MIEPIDVVYNQKDHTLTTLDHRRVVAARAKDVNQRVVAVIHQPDTMMPIYERRRFRCNTWGEAVQSRLQNNIKRRVPSPELPRIRSGSPTIKSRWSQ